MQQELPVRADTEEIISLISFASTSFSSSFDKGSAGALKCTIEMPSSVQDIFRPPVECSMCRHVTRVERVSTITPAEFERKYAYSGRPVVVTDGQRNWTAPQSFSFEFFKSIYADDSPVLENFERDCQFFPYQTDFMNLRHVFNMSHERANMLGEPWYIGWSNCDSSAANILRGHYERPYFLPQSAESSKTDWIFIGTPGYGAHLHSYWIRTSGTTKP